MDFLTMVAEIVIGIVWVAIMIVGYTLIFITAYGLISLLVR